MCSVMPDSQPARFLHPWNFPGKNTRVGYHFLLQGIFLTLTQGSNLHLLRLLHWRQIPYHLSHQGSLYELELCINKVFCKKKKKKSKPQTYHFLSLISSYLYCVSVVDTHRLSCLQPSCRLSMSLLWGGFPKGVRIHSLVFAWTIPWTEEPGGLQATMSPTGLGD